jgi:hypothetical protein
MQYVLAHVKLFANGDFIQKYDNIFLWQLIKPQFEKLVLKPNVYFANVVANQTKADII